MLRAVFNQTRLVQLLEKNEWNLTSPTTFPIEMNERHMGFAKDFRLGLQRPCRLPALALCAQSASVSRGEPGKTDICVAAGILQGVHAGHQDYSVLYWICLRLIWLALAWIT